MRHNHLDAALLRLRDRFALDTRRDLAVNKVLHESTNLIMRDLFALVEGEFLVLDSLLDSEGGPFVGFEVQVARVGSKGLGVDGGDVELAFVFLGDGLEFFGEGSALFFRFRENVAQGNASL